jgi:hypothetical protein
MIMKTSTILMLILQLRYIASPNLKPFDIYGPEINHCPLQVAVSSSTMWLATNMTSCQLIRRSELYVVKTIYGLKIRKKSDCSIKIE